MIRYLINRPIAVISSFFILIFWGGYCFFLIPVSLLPDISVPEVVIKYNYDNSSEYIEKEVTEILRSSFSNMDNLVNIEGVSGNQNGMLKLHFENGTQMNYKFIEINEIIDRNISRLPSGMERPKISLINTSDIPVIKIQIVPKNGSVSSISDVTEKTIKKRFEQIKGVSTVDLNGAKGERVSIIPNLRKLLLFGVSENAIIEGIKSSNIDIGSLNIKDGNYEYFLRIKNESIPLDSIKVKTKNSSVVALTELAEIRNVPIETYGGHLFNNEQGIVLTIQKLSSARMNELMTNVESTIKSVQKDFPQLKISQTQNQTFLLNAGIDNLYSDLIYGSIICFIIIVLILGNYASTLVIFISIPLSFLLTCLFFYLFNISFNIISLSGLALGVGMLIDNSIVVIDNITRKRKEGKSIDDSCVEGIKEIYATVISQVLTTVAIYIPLIYLDGSAGDLVLDQALALTISLFISVLIAFFLNPILYKLLLRGTPEQLKKETKVYLFLSQQYHKLISWILKNRTIAFIIILALSVSTIFMFKNLELNYLPSITETESLIEINWNEPISITESEKRVKSLMADQDVVDWEADIGLSQFLLDKEISDIQNVKVYTKMDDPKIKSLVDGTLRDRLSSEYPKAKYSIISAPNAFTQLFSSKEPFVEIRFRTPNQSFIDDLKSKYSDLKYFSEFEYIYEISLNQKFIALNNVPSNEIINTLKTHFGSNNITELQYQNVQKVISLDLDSEGLNQILNSPVLTLTGNYMPLRNFISVKVVEHPRRIYSDKNGIYQALHIEKNKGYENFLEDVQSEAIKHNTNVEIHGEISKIRSSNITMIYIFLISFFLLYFILLIEFQNFHIPLIILATIPLGIFGSFLLLLLTGNSLNIMSAMGFIVVLGIIIDDPILKVENILRLRRESPNIDTTTLLHKAGEISLKPMLLTSLTTSLALLPMLFAPGIGNELQRPMIIVIVGGLTIGTFFALWVLPIVFSVLFKPSK